MPILGSYVPVVIFFAVYALFPLMILAGVIWVMGWMNRRLRIAEDQANTLKRLVEVVSERNRLEKEAYGRA